MIDNGELRTWKEIAAYVGVSVRTAQNYVRDAGLPVSRLAPHGQIRSDKASLDAWKAAHLQDVVTTAPVEDHGVASPRHEESSIGLLHWTRRRALVATGTLVLLILLASIVLARSGKRPVRPSRFNIEQRLLTVYNEGNQEIWHHVFPNLVIEDKQSENGPWSLYRHQFVDLDRRGDTNLLFGVHEEIYCFSSSGRVLWHHRPGRSVVDRSGRVIPNDFQVGVVGTLSRPRSDGGQIIVGASHGPGALFIVELLTKEGRKVAEYFHYGWFFGVVTGALRSGGPEDIFLGGVDNISGGKSDYGTTLVVLDPNRFDGQASTLAPDPRGLRDIATAQEKALLLLKEFVPNPIPYNYCHPEAIRLLGDGLEFVVTQGSNQPKAHFMFDEHLRVRSVVPDAFLLSALHNTLLKGRPENQRPEVITQILGDIRYLRNGFDGSNPRD